MSLLPSSEFCMAHGQPARVLIVDDQPVNLEVVGAVLGKLGCEIVVATDGATALRRVELRPVDLILLDLNMPSMDGYEVCRRLREAGSGEIPVIFLSASTEKDLVVKALDSGGVDYITKPFNHAELISRVRTQLALKNARDRLKQLAEDKDELIGILAHDLKSHLGGIQMSAQLLQDRVVRNASSDSKVGLMAENIAHTSGQLLSFVRGFLANAAADHGVTINLEGVELGHALRTALDSVQNAARRKGIEFLLETPLPNALVSVDPSALSQVIDNLLTNALKFSPPGKKVFVRLLESESSIEFSVEDQGPGFTEADKAKLFRRYARLSARPTAGEPSTGLGLSIVRKLVLAMKGELNYESEPGRGTKFMVRFPRRTTH